ncbi:MAG: sulfotransferase [Actinomycetota bacterium]|nr:sulfotransferase [Actinomycetota bacterium]
MLAAIGSSRRDAQWEGSQECDRGTRESEQVTSTSSRFRSALVDPAEAWTRVRRRYLHQLFFDPHWNAGESVFVAGSGRSGTTWLADAINWRNEYRFIFEPFHPQRSPLGGRHLARQYVRPEVRDVHLSRCMASVLSGRVRSEWTDRHNRKRLVGRRLIKDIWSHLLLPWLRAQFPLVKIVLILRHPFAVVNSQRELRGWGWGADLGPLLRQADLLKDHLGPMKEHLRGAATEFEVHLFCWCIENYVPLRQLGPGEAHVIFYEDLCVAPGKEAHRLSVFLDKRFDEGWAQFVRKPSFAATEKSIIRSGGDPLQSWQERLTADEVSRGLEILSLFGLDQIYADAALPRVEARDALQCLAT